jgi:hypothetical protein
LIRRSGDAYRLGDNGKGLWIGGWVIGWMPKPRLRPIDSDKGTWIGGVKDSCHRYQPCSCYNDFRSEGDFFHILNSRLRREILGPGTLSDSPIFVKMFFPGSLAACGND